MDICELYNFTFTGKGKNGLEPFGVFSLFQAALVIIVNIFALTVLSKTRASYDKVTQLFFKALSLTYLLLGLTSLGQAICSDILQMNHFAYKLSTSITSSFLFLSLGFLLCINVNRYLMIVWPLRYQSVVTIRRAWIMVSALVVLSTSQMTVFLLPGTYYDHYAEAIAHCDRAAIHKYMLQLRPLMIFVTLLFVAFLTVTTFTNLRTLVIANRLNTRTRKQIQYLSSVSGNQATVETDPAASVAGPLESSTAVPKGNHKEASKTRKICRATWTVSVITLSLYLAWLPQIILMVFSIVLASPSKSWVFTTVALVHGNMWWTPIIYIGTDRKYRQTVKGIFQKKNQGQNYN